MEKIIIKLPYIDKITVSQKRRPKFHHKSRFKPFNLQGKELPKRFKSEAYKWGNDGFLYHSVSNEKVIANPKVAGEAKYWVINLQPIYNGNLKPVVRASYMKILKNTIKDWFDIPPITEFPLRFELFIYSKEMKVDLDNKSSLFYKAISDVLTEKAIIPDDNSDYIRDTGRCVWIPVNHSSKEKMEFHISKIE